MPRKPQTRDVAFSNVQKVFFPAANFTKGDVIKYYIEVAPVLLPHFRGRPVTLIRFPDGIHGEKFYEKNAPGHAPEWIATTDVPRTEGGVIHYIMIDDARTLAWCANLAAIELHPFLHCARAIQRPTHLAFDLDPGEGADILTCLEVGFMIRDLLAQLGLQSFPKVSGSKGLQLYVPLNTPVTYDVATPFAQTVAELLHRQHPDLIVSDMSKALRVGKVLIDWSQNHEKKTTVGPYSLRAKREYPFVSMPITWDEAKAAAKKADPERLNFSPVDALRRTRRHGDLFAPVLKLKQKLPPQFAAAVPKTKSHRTPKALARYAAKRNFSQTPEPGPELPHATTQGSPRRFVIQKHAASHLHYDFRLEMGGVLKSWAVPKGLSTEAGVKRSAFQVEDHPFEYFSFEGTIPAGQYGGGTVMVWDVGTYEILGGNYGQGDLKLWLAGRKLRGEWHIFRIKSEERKPVWLIQKAKEPARPLTAKQENTSILTGRTMEQIAAANDAVWQSNREAWETGQRSRSAPLALPASNPPSAAPRAARRRKSPRKATVAAPSRAGLSRRRRRSGR